MTQLPHDDQQQLPQDYAYPASKHASEQALEAAEFSSYLLAKTYFDVHEYDRAAFVLKDAKSKKSRFLALYARYIAGEKRKEEDSEMVLGPLDGGQAINKEVLPILAAIEVVIAEQAKKREPDTEDDSFLLFLYGIVLKRQGNEADARGAFIKSVNLYPYNWSTWQELGATIGSISDVCTPPPEVDARQR